MQCDPSRLILRQMVRGSARAVRAIRNTRVFQTETRVIADVGHMQLINILNCAALNVRGYGE